MAKSPEQFSNKDSEEPSPDFNLEVPPKLSPEIKFAEEKPEKDGELRQAQEELSELLKELPVVAEQKEIEKQPVEPDKYKTNSGATRRIVGEFLGRNIFKNIPDFFRRRAKNFDIRCQNAEVLQELKNKSYILVANHIRPTSKILQKMAIPPDAFALERVVAEKTGKPLRSVVKCDDGWWAKGLWRHVQKMVQPLGEGIVKGMGFIPIRKNPGSVNRNFLRDTEEAVGVGEPILIFPEGRWYEDFSSDHKLESGAAHLALKNNVTIVPAYIKGCDSWKPEHGIDIMLGEPIMPGEKGRDEITEEIREKIAELQENFNQK